MTNNEMRVAIAEACGWVRYQFPDGNIKVRWAKWKRPDRCLMADIPDYPNDLNAMAEAEKTLTDEQWNSYRNHLHNVAWKAVKDMKPLPEWTRMEGCTAAQRAEAFLRTIGKWKDA